MKDFSDISCRYQIVLFGEAYNRLGRLQRQKQIPLAILLNNLNASKICLSHKINYPNLYFTINHRDSNFSRNLWNHVKTLCKNWMNAAEWTKRGQSKRTPEHNATKQTNGQSAVAHHESSKKKVKDNKDNYGKDISYLIYESRVIPNRICKTVLRKSRKKIKNISRHGSCYNIVTVAISVVFIIIIIIIIILLLLLLLLLIIMRSCG